MASVIRHESALSFRQIAIVQTALKDVAQCLDRLSRAHQVRARDAAEREQSTGDPDLDAGAEA